MTCLHVTALLVHPDEHRYQLHVPASLGQGFAGTSNACIHKFSQCMHGL
jgi:hypothetical protein